MREIKTAFVQNLAATGQVVAAVPGKRINVLGYLLSASAATVANWQSGGATAVSANHAMAANGGFVVPFSEYGWGITTAESEALQLAVTVGGVGVQVVYELVG